MDYYEIYIISRTVGIEKSINQQTFMLQPERS